MGGDGGNTAVGRPAAGDETDDRPLPLRGPARGTSAAPPVPDLSLATAPSAREPSTAPPARPWFGAGAAQQPVWSNPWLLEKVRRELSGRPGPVAAADTARLRSLLAQAAAGRMGIVQAGDCAEDPAECTAAHVRAKVALLDTLGRDLEARSGLPVLRIGRMAGQFAKPRSRPTERVGGRELPSYRGPLVNGPAPTDADRAPDLLRLTTGHHLAVSVMNHLTELGRGPGAPDEAVVWTSHEALLLDYEVPLLRRLSGGDLLLSSTHVPWIGDRTRQLDGAHVRLLSSVINPVACKVGPALTPDELLRLCQVLDPGREPGRLTLVARLGAGLVRTGLPPLVRAVRRAGHPVIWLCDPMHGNTVLGARGRKTRAVTALIRELEGFQDAVRAEGGVAGGVHLEATPNAVAECVRDTGDEPGDPYTTLCDPRLNPEQARAVLAAWRRPAVRPEQPGPALGVRCRGHLPAVPGAAPPGGPAAAVPPRADVPGTPRGAVPGVAEPG
ncbi:3-deoxy-7-phosphoheptulonate synthase [Streptomyces sp. NPDC001922]|uniref:3-deoxy-7-phosphoheptulonate synthase n=1 Tax=Streptomyces sp. NPDC001922 TaxID=3364624 RepID=UPI0036844342